MIKPSIPCLTVTLLLLLATILVAPVEGGWELASPHQDRFDMGPAEPTFGRYDFIWNAGEKPRQVTIHSKPGSGEPATTTATVHYTVFMPLYIGQMVVVLVVGGLVTLWFSTHGDDEDEAAGT